MEHRSDIPEVGGLIPPFPTRASGRGWSAVAGRNPVALRACRFESCLVHQRRVAQRLEHQVYTLSAEGSSPSLPTTGM